MLQIPGHGLGDCAELATAAPPARSALLRLIAYRLPASLTLAFLNGITISVPARRLFPEVCVLASREEHLQEAAVRSRRTRWPLSRLTARPSLTRLLKHSALSPGGLFSLLRPWLAHTAWRRARHASAHRGITRQYGRTPAGGSDVGPAGDVEDSSTSIACEDPAKQGHRAQWTEDEGNATSI